MHGETKMSLKPHRSCGTKPTFETPLKLPILPSRTLRGKVPEVYTRTSRLVYAHPFGPMCPAGDSALTELLNGCIVVISSAGWMGLDLDASRRDY